jgi:hypothetical protein
MGMRSVRGFTLTEAALAMALVGVISIAAIGLYASVSQTFTATRKAAMLNDRAQSAIDYLMHDLRSIGGNGIPASVAIFVEDAAGARADPVTGFPDGSDAAAGVEGRPPLPGMADRLTTFTAIQNVPGCTITGITGPPNDTDGEGTAQFLLTPCPSCNPPVAFGTCCFTMGIARPFVRTVVLMSGNSFRPVMLSNSSGTCQFRWQDVVPASMRPAPTPVPPISDYIGGQAVLVDFRTYYLDAQTHDLMMHIDNLPGEPAQVGAVLNDYGANPSVVGERFRVLDGVYDFQVSLGYDLDASGDVTEGAGGGDEWLYNFPGETEAAMSGFNSRLLRLVRVEMVVGLPMGGSRGGAAVSSPARTPVELRVPGVGLRAAGQRFAPRNVDLGGGT